MEDKMEEKEKNIIDLLGAYHWLSPMFLFMVISLSFGVNPHNTKWIILSFLITTPFWLIILFKPNNLGNPTPDLKSKIHKWILIPLFILAIYKGITTEYLAKESFYTDVLLWGEIIGSCILFFTLVNKKEWIEGTNSAFGLYIIIVISTLVSCQFYNQYNFINRLCCHKQIIISKKIESGSKGSTIYRLYSDSLEEVPTSLVPIDTYNIVELNDTIAHIIAKGNLNYDFLIHYKILKCKTQ
jgi:predicted Na+-dependent transporter